MRTNGSRVFFYFVLLSKYFYNSLIISMLVKYNRKIKPQKLNVKKNTVIVNTK